LSAGLILASNLSTIVLMPRFGPKPLVASGMLAAAGAMAWLAQLGPHTAYAGGVLGPTILAGIAAVTSYLAAHLAAARLIGRPALTGLALAHGYDTAFWWTAGIFAAGAVTAGALLRPGPLRPASTPPPAHAEVATAQAKADPALPG
ncbi:MAG TPA: hypothetical protein VJ347_05760, partial [Streptosporangiaceae bacterium]|nr:hypothetical protein [Streptosporangiaceae bacterium]